MRVNKETSQYQEAPDARLMFSSSEMDSLRVLLRRLRLLEANLKAGRTEKNGGAVWAAREIKAFVIVLTEIGFLAPPGDSPDYLNVYQEHAQQR